MGSEKAWYWIAVGVLALFVSNNFADRHLGEVRCLASRSLAAVEQLPGHATGLTEITELMLGRGETRFAQTQTKLARVQTRLASVQTTIACRQAAFARVQAERDRMIALQDLERTVVCPRPNLRIVVPQPFEHGSI